MSELEGEPTLPPRACIPWTHGTPPTRATACEVSSVFADGSTQRARYDADGHLLELRTSTAEGALSQVETHVWRDGLERSRRVDFANGDFDLTEWTHDARRRLSRWVRTGSGTHAYVTSSADFTYDAQDRISQVVSHLGHRVLTNDYAYDAAGRLVSIRCDDECGMNESRCATLSYWPNGRLKRNEWQEGRTESFTDEYDELGQLIHSTSSHGEGAGWTSRSYDATGRLSRLRHSFNSTTREREVLSTTVYDPAGQRERLAEDAIEYFSCEDSHCPVIHKRVTRRTTFICDTRLVALDEWDSDENGVVDARRTHVRDATGRLVHEEYSGTPGLDWLAPVRRDFRYDCP